MAAYGLPSATVVTPLGEPYAPGSREDRSCDRCRRYLPPGELLYGGWFETAQLAARFTFTFGLCEPCAVLEAGPAEVRRLRADDAR